MAIEAGSSFSDEELFENLNLTSATSRAKSDHSDKGAPKLTELDRGREMAHDAETAIDDIDALLKTVKSDGASAIAAIALDEEVLAAN